MKPDVRQIVLSNGQEVLCEVVQWPDLDIDEQEVMIIRKACKIIIQENFEQGTRWFTFRPFMTYHIITIGNPSETLRKQYKKYLKLLGEEENADRAEDPFQYFQVGDSDMPPDNILHFKIDKNKLN